METFLLNVNLILRYIYYFNYILNSVSNDIENFHLKNTFSLFLNKN